jgi:hypothetical protein
MRFSCARSRPILLASVMSLRALHAGAETTKCTPIDLTYLPYVISAPGSYCLTQDYFVVAKSTPAIAVKSSDVVIDLNGHTLETLHTPGTMPRAIEVRAPTGPSIGNITIRNGVLRRFYIGVEVAGDDVTVEDVVVDKTNGIGIELEGVDDTVRRCEARAMGWDTATPSTAIHVAAIAESAVVEDNAIDGTEVSGWNAAIHIDGPNALVVENRMINVSVGLSATVSPTSGVYRGNIVVGATSSAFAVAGMTDGKNNVSK